MRTLDTRTYLIVHYKKYQIKSINLPFFSGSLYSLDMRMLTETFNLICIGSIFSLT